MKTTESGSKGTKTGVIRKSIMASFAILIILGFAACSRPATAKADGAGSHGSAPQGKQDPRAGHFGRRGPIDVQATTARSGILTANHMVSGSVVPVTQSQVAAQVSGVVARVVHQAGDWVKTGDPVVVLDDSQLKLALDNAKVALKNARINLDVGQQNATQANPKLTLQLQSAEAAVASAQKNYSATEELFKSGGASASAVDTARSQLQTAQANVQAAKSALTQNQQSDTQNIAQLQLSVDQAQNQLQQAELNLQNGRISAPFAGQIASVNVTPGEFVGQNSPAFLLVSAAKEVSFSISPVDAPALTPGRQVTFTVSGTDYRARVAQTPSAPINGVVPMVATFTSSDQNLPYGSVGNVSYQVNLAKGTLIPIPSLQTDGSQTYVFTIVAGKAHRQPVNILAETADYAAVTELSASSEVIVSPPPGLLEGSDVTAANTATGKKASAAGGNQ